MKSVLVLAFLCLVACGVSVRAEASETVAVAQTDAAAQQKTETTAVVAAASEADSEAEAEAEGEVEAEGESEAESEVEVTAQSQAELDAAHENTVQTLEEYAEKAHALRDEIISSEHSLMEAMAQIDTCPPSELSGLMARAKKQITHLFQIKALYLAIKQQEAQLRALVEAGTGSRAPSVAPKQPAPAKPAAAAAAARPAPASAAKAADYSALAAMNAKLHNALARLESVTARLAKVEHRQTKAKKATLLVAGQMETDEKRLNKHSRVLRRVRDNVKQIKLQLARLEKSCARGARAERRLTPLRKRSAKGKARRSQRKAAKAARKSARKAARKSARKAARKSARKAARKASRKQRKIARKYARKPRSGALKRCLSKCRAAFPAGRKANAKKCALRCFRRHSHRARSTKGKGRKGKGKGRKGKPVNRRALRACTRQCRALRGKGKAATRALRVKCQRTCARRYGPAVQRAPKFDLKKCLRRCPKSRKQPKRASKRCTSACYAAARRARKSQRKAKAANLPLKRCFKTCRKGKRWDQKCVKRCRSKYGRKAKAAAKRWSPKRLNACLKTCSGKSRVALRRGRRVVVRGKTDAKCVRSCKARFGAPRPRRQRKPNVALKRCYATCKSYKGKGKAHRMRWDMKCVKRCQRRFGRRPRAVPQTAAYKACLKRCRPGKAYAKCKRACAAHNRPIKVKVVSPSSKAVAAAIKGLKKKGKAGKKRPETWEDVVRDSRRLLKKSVRLRDLVHKQVARHFDEKDVEGRKYNGWWSIWDVLKGVKPGKHYSGRAKEIAADVRQIMAPALAKAADGPYGEVVNVLRGADEAFSSKFTKELGSPALDLSVDPKFDGYVEKPLPGAKIRHVPYNPKKPYEPSKHTWKKSPPLSRLPELMDEPYNTNLRPIYAKEFKVVPRKAAGAEIPFGLATKNWDYPQIPYSYPVTMVKHDPRNKNPHVRAPTPGFHNEWPEYRFQQTEAKDAAPATAPAPQQTAEAPAAAAPAPADQQPMTEGNDA